MGAYAVPPTAAARCNGPAVGFSPIAHTDRQRRPGEPVNVGWRHSTLPAFRGCREPKATGKRSDTRKTEFGEAKTFGGPWTLPCSMRGSRSFCGISEAGHPPSPRRFLQLPDGFSRQVLTSRCSQGGLRRSRGSRELVKNAESQAQPSPADSAAAFPSGRPRGGLCLPRSEQPCAGPCAPHSVTKLWKREPQSWEGPLEQTEGNSFRSMSSSPRHSPDCSIRLCLDTSVTLTPF